MQTTSAPSVRLAIGLTTALSAVFAWADDLSVGGGGQPSLTDGAAVYTWIGGSQGAFGEASNWDPSGVPSVRDSVACFTNSAAVSISGGFCEVRVRGGDVALSHTYRFSGVASSAKEVTVDVGEGASLSLTQANSDFFGGSRDVTFVKKGAGLCAARVQLSHWSVEEQMFKTLDVRAGTLAFDGKVLHTFDRTVRVAAGARLVGASGVTLIPSDYAVLLDGVLDLSNPASSQTLRALIGAGVVSNASANAAAPLVLRNEGAAAGSEGAFAGRYFGHVCFAPTNGAPITVAAADMFAGAAVTVSEGAGARPFQFAAGIGTFTVTDAALFAGYATDLAGEPIAFRLALVNGFVHAADGDDDWSHVTAIADGRVTERSGGTWTLGALEMDGGELVVDAKASGSQLVLNGGCVSNAVLSFGTAPYRFVNQGADISTRAQLELSSGVTLAQTSGRFCAYPLLGRNSTNEIFCSVSGGEFLSVVRDYYGMGLGLDVSGTARAVLRRGEKGAHALAWGANGHTLRVRGDAVAEADDLDFWYYTGGASTGAVELAENGLLAVSGSVGNWENRIPIEAAGAYIAFDGGTLRSTLDGDVRWPRPLAGIRDGQFNLCVKAGGATIDVPRTDAQKGLSWEQPVVAVGDGRDGGLTKTGAGRLVFSRRVALSGPVRVLSGTLSSAYLPVDDSTHAYGTGSMELVRGILSVDAAGRQSVATGSDAILCVEESGVIHLARLGASALTVGAAGATASPLRVASHTALVFALPYGRGMEDQGNGFAENPVMVNGGLGQSGSLGFADVPILMANIPQECAYSRNRGQRLWGLVTCDAAGALRQKLPTCTNDVPASCGVETFLRVGANYDRSVGFFSLPGDCAVGALEVRGSDNGDFVGGLDIPAGRRLAVGGVAGGVAQVLLNNVITPRKDRGLARIVGAGTLDFGASEGFVAVSSSAEAFFDGNVSVIGATVAGTAGVTFYGLARAEAIADYGRWRCAVRLGGHSAYSGGTWINGASVLPRHADSLGVGDIHVMGDAHGGGELVFGADYAGGDFSVPVSLAGVGASFGAALWAESDVRLTGPVTLTGDTTIGAAAGATLELAAVGGTGVLTVVGGGVVRLAGDASSLGGLVVKGGRIEFAPGARVADGAITACPGASVFLPDGYVLDLGGQTLQVASVGGSGIVRNGTLVITGEIQPGGVQAVGTLTFERAPVVAGATLVVDGDGRGGFDRLVVEEAFDVTGMRIRLSRRAGFAPGTHRVVSCRSLAGQDALVPDLPRHFAVGVPASCDGIDLVREQLGTLLLIR